MAQQLRCGFDVGVVAERYKNDAFINRGNVFATRNASVPQKLIPATPLTRRRSPRSPLSCLASQETSSFRRYEIRKRDPNPEAAALLVVDMQNYFASMAEPIMGHVLTTIDLCRRASMPVFFTRHNHKSEEDYGMLEEWSLDGMILDGSDEAELMPEIRSRVLSGNGEIVEKNTYSAFANTGLQEKLKEMGVEEVIVTGVMTNLCCETTAREAFVRGFRVFFSTDATATSNEQLHEATLMNLAFGFAYLVDCQTLRTGLRLRHNN